MKGHPLVRWALTLVGIAVSGVFLYLAVRNVNFRVFRHALAKSDYWWVIPSLALLALAVFLRVVRWRLLFSPANRPRVKSAASALLIGAFFNNILPLRAGELAQVVALHRRARASRLETLGTVAAQRVYDTLSLLLMLFVAVPFLPHVTWIRRAGILAIIATALTVALIVILAVYRDRPVRILLRPLTRLPGISEQRVEEAAANLINGLTAFRHPVIALVAFVLTLLSWLVFILSYWLLMVGMHLHLGIGAALLVLITTNLALLLPSSPAGVGVFEAATRVALGAYGISPSTALSYGVVLHVITFAPFVIAGMVLVEGPRRFVARALFRSSRAQPSRKAASP